MSLVDQNQYFRDKLNKLSMRDYTELMRKYVREGGVEIREFDKAIEELLGDKELETMTNKNKLLQLANLTREKLVLESEFEKLKKEVTTEEGFDRVVYNLPTQNQLESFAKSNFVAIRDNKTGDWVTTEDCRFIFKRKYTNNKQQSSMLPVGIINLETNEVVVFSLGENKRREEKNMANSRLVTLFYPGFYVRKNIDGSCPPYSVNLKRDMYYWFHYNSPKINYTYELVTPSNPEQIQEVGTPVIGYIPFVIGVRNFNDFEFYQAYN